MGSLEYPPVVESPTQGFSRRQVLGIAGSILGGVLVGGCAEKSPGPQIPPDPGGRGGGEVVGEKDPNKPYLKLEEDLCKQITDNPTWREQVALTAGIPISAITPESCVPGTRELGSKTASWSAPYQAGKNAAITIIVGKRFHELPKGGRLDRLEIIEASSTYQEVSDSPGTFFAPGLGTMVVRSDSIVSVVLSLEDSSNPFQPHPNAQGTIALAQSLA